MAEGQLVSKQNAHDHDDGDGFEEAKIKLGKIVMKKTDDVSKMVNISKHEEPLSPAACVISDPLLDGYIFTIVGFEKEIDVESLKVLLQKNLAEHQRFSSVSEKDKHNNLKWCAREVVIEDHVIVPSLSVSTVKDLNFVNEYTTSLMTAPPLDPCRPLWEVHVLNVSSGDVAASLVFRIHHSLGDCISMLSLLINSTTKAPNPNVSHTILQHKPSYQRSTGFLQIVYNVIAGLWLTFLCVYDYMIVLLWNGDQNLLKEASRAKISSKRLAHVTLNIEDICLVKKAVNGTLNDVIMGALSAGFVRYMSRRQYMAEKMTRSSDQKASADQHLPLNISLRAMVAVNMRETPVLKDLDRNMKTPSKSMWGNKLGFWMIPFPTFHYGDPLQYCRVTKMMSRLKKLSFEASLIYAITKHMPTKLVAYICTKLAESTTLGISNVMGPVEQIQYGDNPITHIIPTAHLNYHSIVMHFISYAGKGKLVALVPEDVIGDPQQLCEDCAGALRVMKEAATKSTPLNLS
ncbi:wax ester synthase/diacylglycerol acyltransferase 7 isoform X1 [Cryptomeria japonica]|uniref:wax ester synthase/diacylglycerol acyltransferase 7 isoform X1 n=1 Tax=Cryptomeria japonica TaxID=3369 RepID=UPI0027DA149F|nr:wax ester synthase/diacylglycerol acyltransferase 7 isoform X1 [Cryptomeria japonica]